MKCLGKIRFLLGAVMLLVMSAGAVLATDSDERDEKIAKLQAEYDALKPDFYVLEGYVKIIRREGVSLPSLREAIKRTKVLGEQLEDLRAGLNALRRHGGGDTPKPTRIRIARNTFGGPPLGPGESVALDDILTFSADIVHLGALDYPVLESFVWQLFGPDNAPVAGVSKMRELSAQGVKEAADDCLRTSAGIGCFRFRLNTLANGHYTVALTQQNATDPDKMAQSQAGFEVFQPVRLTRLVVDISPEGRQNHETLYNDQAPHLFAYYLLGEGIDTIVATLKVTDETSGETIYEQSLTRERKEDQDEQRLGIRIKPGRIAIGHTARFDVVLRTADGAETSKDTSFAVSAYKLALDIPTQVTSGVSRPFAIKVPDSFTPPFEIALNVHSGLSLGHSPGSLQGTITGFAEDDVKDTRLDVRVTDAKGRTANTVVSIHIVPKPKPAPKPAIYAGDTTTGSSTTSTATAYDSDDSGGNAPQDSSIDKAYSDEFTGNELEFLCNTSEVRSHFVSSRTIAGLYFTKNTGRKIWDKLVPVKVCNKTFYIDRIAMARFKNALNTRIVAGYKCISFSVDYYSPSSEKDHVFCTVK